MAPDAKRNDGIVMYGGTMSAKNVAVGPNATAGDEVPLAPATAEPADRSSRRVYKVFVSYSWANSAERQSLVDGLRHIDAVEVLVDMRTILPGDGIHSTLRSMIDEADCVVALLTNEGLSSREVRAELDWAHQQEKLIIPIVSAQIRLDALPSYLHDVNAISYDERHFDTVLASVIHTIDRRAASANDSSGPGG
jgi:hypothetical protein